jgi:hypothetical protein
MRYVFDTERLAVCEVELPPEFGEPFTMYLAFEHGMAFRVAVSCTVNVHPISDGPPYLGWIETSSRLRRKGLAAELWRGVEKYLGRRIYGDGVTMAGRRLCGKLEVHHDR